MVHLCVLLNNTDYRSPINQSQFS